MKKIIAISTLLASLIVNASANGIKPTTYNSCTNDFTITDSHNNVVLFEPKGEMLSISDFVISNSKIDNFLIDKNFTRFSSMIFFTDGFLHKNTIFKFPNESKENFKQILNNGYLFQVACFKNDIDVSNLSASKASDFKTVYLNEQTQKLIEQFVLENTIHLMLQNADGGITLGNNPDSIPKNITSNEDLNSKIENLKIKNNQKLQDLKELEKVERTKFIEAKKNKMNSIFTVRADALVRVEMLIKLRNEI